MVSDKDGMVGNTYEEKLLFKIERHDVVTEVPKWVVVE